MKNNKLIYIECDCSGYDNDYYGNDIEIEISEEITSVEDLYSQEKLPESKQSKLYKEIMAIFGSNILDLNSTEKHSKSHEKALNELGYYKESQWRNLQSKANKIKFDKIKTLVYVDKPKTYSYSKLTKIFDITDIDRIIKQMAEGLGSFYVEVNPKDILTPDQMQKYTKLLNAKKEKAEKAKLKRLKKKKRDEQKKIEEAKVLLRKQGESL